MILVALLAAGLLALIPASAAAAGALPAAGIDAQPLSVPSGEVGYTTERAGRDTRLIESARYGGPLRERRLHGAFSIPAVAYDSTASGLSADGRTLVLISPRRRYPRELTTLAVVDTRTLRVRRQIALRGDFGVDAISPDGRLLYLIEYSPRNPAEYAVRAYDMRARRVLPEPVVDPSEEDEPMTGVPVTRVTSLDGRWAYTLYQSAEHPFVHALDTERRTAVCIDLDELEQVWNMRLDLRGTRLEVVGRTGRVRAAIDTRTHRLISPLASQAEPDAGTSWLPIAAPTAALLLLAMALRRLARRRSRV
jgi:hypothetical protein